MGDLVTRVINDDSWIDDLIQLFMRRNKEKSSKKTKLIELKDFDISDLIHFEQSKQDNAIKTIAGIVDVEKKTKDSKKARKLNEWGEEAEEKRAAEIKLLDSYGKSSAAAYNAWNDYFNVKSNVLVPTYDFYNNSDVDRNVQSFKTNEVAMISYHQIKDIVKHASFGFGGGYHNGANNVDVEFYNLWKLFLFNQILSFYYFDTAAQ